MVDVVADPEREVHVLGLEPLDLATQDLERVDVLFARHAQQLVVALVAAEGRVGQVEEDDRGLGEVGKALVLDPAAGDEIAGTRRLDDVIGEDRALRRQLVDEDLTGERLVPDARPAIPRRSLPEALRRGVRIFLGRIEALLGGRPGRRGAGAVVDREVGRDARPVERLGRGPEGLRPEAERLALVATHAPVLAGRAV
jgi:hypothetical protein